MQWRLFKWLVREIAVGFLSLFRGGMKCEECDTLLRHWYGRRTIPYRNWTRWRSSKLNGRICFVCAPFVSPRYVARNIAKTKKEELADKLDRLLRNDPSDDIWLVSDTELALDDEEGRR